MVASGVLFHPAPCTMAMTPLIPTSVSHAGMEQDVESCADVPRSPGYFNATPAACAIWAFGERLALKKLASANVPIPIDVIIPQYWDNRTVDLVVAGPNEGQNTGEFLYTLSGTIGATYASVERGVRIQGPICRPAITNTLAVSGNRVLSRKQYSPIVLDQYQLHDGPCQPLCRRGCELR